jgi:hypothetical protein
MPDMTAPMSNRINSQLACNFYTGKPAAPLRASRQMLKDHSRFFSAIQSRDAAIGVRLSSCTYHELVYDVATLFPEWSKQTWLLGLSTYCQRYREYECKNSAWGVGPKEHAGGNIAVVDLLTRQSLMAIHKAEQAELRSLKLEERSRLLEKRIAAIPAKYLPPRLRRRNRTRRSR